MEWPHSYFLTISFIFLFFCAVQNTIHVCTDGIGSQGAQRVNFSGFFSSLFSCACQNSIMIAENGAQSIGFHITKEVLYQLVYIYVYLKHSLFVSK